MMDDWRLCQKRVYEVSLCRGNPAARYNTPNAGEVYNVLEDVTERVQEGCYVCRGTMGELYVLPEARLSAYDVVPTVLDDTWRTVCTKPQSALYCYRRPVGPFVLQTAYGAMHGNRAGVEHGSGDVVVCAALPAADGWAPDEADCWIVNGRVFADTYQAL